MRVHVHVHAHMHMACAHAHAHAHARARARAHTCQSRPATSSPHLASRAEVDAVAHAQGLRRVEEVAAHHADRDAARPAAASPAAERRLDARSREARDLLQHPDHHRVRDAQPTCGGRGRGAGPRQGVLLGWAQGRSCAGSGRGLRWRGAVLRGREALYACTVAARTYTYTDTDTDTYVYCGSEGSTYTDTYRGSEVPRPSRAAVRQPGRGSR